MLECYDQLLLRICYCALCSVVVQASLSYLAYSLDSVGIFSLFLAPFPLLRLLHKWVISVLLLSLSCSICCIFPEFMCPYLVVYSWPYCVYACIAPTMRFLLMFGVMPPPLSMKGTSWAFVFSALVSYFSRCRSCLRSYWIIFPRYLYSLTHSISLP